MTIGVKPHQPQKRHHSAQHHQRSQQTREHSRQNLQAHSTHHQPGQQALPAGRLMTAAAHDDSPASSPGESATTLKRIASA